MYGQVLMSAASSGTLSAPAISTWKNKILNPLPAACLIVKSQACIPTWMGQELYPSTSLFLHPAPPMHRQHRRSLTSLPDVITRMQRGECEECPAECSSLQLPGKLRQKYPALQILVSQTTSWLQPDLIQKPLPAECRKGAQI